MLQRCVPVWCASWPTHPRFCTFLHWLPASVQMGASEPRPGRGSAAAATSDLPHLSVELLELICAPLPLRDRLALASCCRTLWGRPDVAASVALWGVLTLRPRQLAHEPGRASLLAWLCHHRAGLQRLVVEGEGCGVTLMGVLRRYCVAQWPHALPSGMSSWACMLVASSHAHPGRGCALLASLTFNPHFFPAAAWAPRRCATCASPASLRTGWGRRQRWGRSRS